MSQPKTIPQAPSWRLQVWRALPALVIGLSTLVFICQVWSPQLRLHGDIGPFSNGFGYANAVFEGRFCDQHAPIFFYEAHLLQKLLAAVGNGGAVWQIVWLLWVAALSIGTYLVIKFLQTLDPAYGLCSLFFPLCVNTGFLELQKAWTDVGFLAGALLCVGAVVFFLKWQQRKSMILLLAFLLLLNAASYRQNALVCVPVVVMYIAYRLFPAMRCIYALLSAVFVLAAIFLVLHVATYNFIGARQVHPTRTMLLSELKSLALVLNEKNGFFDAQVRDAGDPGKFSAFMDGYVAAECFLDSNNDFTQPENYNRLLKEWKQQVISHPKEMLLVRASEIIQFLYLGGNPTPFRTFMAKYYPHVKLRAKVEKIRGYILQVDELRAGLYLAVYAATFGLCILSLAGWRSKKKQPPPAQFLVLLLSSLSMAYLFSFFLCTPTPDIRYYAFSQFTGLFAFSIYAVDLYLGKKHRCVNDIAR